MGFVNLVLMLTTRRCHMHRTGGSSHELIIAHHSRDVEHTRVYIFDSGLDTTPSVSQIVACTCPVPVCPIQLLPSSESQSPTGSRTTLRATSALIQLMGTVRTCPTPLAVSAA